MPIDQDFLNKMQQFRRTRSNEDVRDSLGVVGAMAEHSRTGESMPSVLRRWMPDYSSTYMSPKEKYAAQVAAIQQANENRKQAYKEWNDRMERLLLSAEKEAQLAQSHIATQAGLSTARMNDSRLRLASRIDDLRGDVANKMKVDSGSTEILDNIAANFRGMPEGGGRQDRHFSAANDAQILTSRVNDSGFSQQREAIRAKYELTDTEMQQLNGLTTEQLTAFLEGRGAVQSADPRARKQAAETVALRMLSLPSNAAKAALLHEASMRLGIPETMIVNQAAVQEMRRRGVSEAEIERELRDPNYAQGLGLFLVSLRDAAHGEISQVTGQLGQVVDEFQEGTAKAGVSSAPLNKALDKIRGIQQQMMAGPMPETSSASTSYRTQISAPADQAQAMAQQTVQRTGGLPAGGGMVSGVGGAGGYGVAGTPGAAQPQITQGQASEQAALDRVMQSQGLDKAQAMLDYIDQFPSSRPSQEMRKQITADPKYAEWKKKMGYEGFEDDLVFRELNRHTRQKSAEQRRKFRQVRKLNRSQEGASPSPRDTTSADLVAGATPPAAGAEKWQTPSR